MTKEKSPPTEPSMDEILASIRQIISDTPKDIVGPLAKHEADDVLDLTDLLPDERSSHSKSKNTDKKPDTFQEDFLSSASAFGKKAERLQPFSKKSFDESLISESTVIETAHALQDLAQFAQEKQRIPTISSLHKETHNQTLENLTREILRPLLKEWLDANLPLLVRWVVNEQVENIIRQKSATPSE